MLYSVLLNVFIVIPHPFVNVFILFLNTCIPVLFANFLFAELAAGKGEEARNIRIWKEKYIEIAALEIEKRLKIMKSAKVSKPALKRMVRIN